MIGMVAFINPAKVRPTKVRGALVFGWTWRRAGFRQIGATAKGLLVPGLDTADMPPAAEPLPGLSGMLA